MRVKLLKRIPLERLMDLKIDYAFKQLFGIEKNKDITVVFLNAILQRTGRKRIKDISFTNTEAGGEYMDDKQSRLDLLVVTDANEWINSERQFSNQYDMVKRSIRSEEHTSELQSRGQLVCRLLLEIKKSSRTMRVGTPETQSGPSLADHCADTRQPGCEPRRSAQHQILPLQAASGRVRELRDRHRQ